MKSIGHYASVSCTYGLRDDVENMFALTAEMAEKYCLGYEL